MKCAAILILFSVALLASNATLIVEEKENEEIGMKEFISEQERHVLQTIFLKRQSDSNNGLTFDKFLVCLSNPSKSIHSFQNMHSFSPGSTPLPKIASSCAKVGQNCSTSAQKFIESETANEKQKAGWTSSGSGWSQNEIPLNCCNQDQCNNGICCTPTPARSSHSQCTKDSDCCLFDQGLASCNTLVGVCKSKIGGTCSVSNDCSLGLCGSTRKCCYPTGGCLQQSGSCSKDTDCCNGGKCSGGICLSPLGGICTCKQDCANQNVCNAGTCSSAGQADRFTHEANYISNNS